MAKKPHNKRRIPSHRASRQELVLAERRQRVADGYLLGKSQWELARVEKVDQSQISRDLAAIRAGWRAVYARDYNEKLDEELARINRVELVAWAAWERSCQDAETRHAETTKGRLGKAGKKPLPDLVKSSKTAKGQAGDPRFLERVGWCIETRLRLLGALQEGAASHTTVVTVLNGVDLAAVTGEKPGIPYERLNRNTEN